MFCVNPSNETIPPGEFAPIIVVGHPRSGTTLLAAMLDRHPDIAVPPETDLFTRATRRQRRVAETRPTHDKLLEFWRLTSGHAASEELRRRVLNHEPTVPNLYRCVLEEHSRLQNKTRCGEKTPWHLLAVPTLLRTFPNARVVCIVRDGRDVVSSCQAFEQFSWEPMWYLCNSWTTAARVAIRFQRRYPKQFTIVRYEDLVTSPEKTLRAMHEFVEIPFSSQQLDHNLPAHVQRPNESFHDDVNRPLKKFRVLAWKQGMTRRQKEYSTGLMDPMLRHFGYDGFRSPSVDGGFARLVGLRACAAVLSVPGRWHTPSMYLTRMYRRLAPRVAAAS